jgi:hypothetical protein
MQTELWGLERRSSIGAGPGVAGNPCEVGAVDELGGLRRVLSRMAPWAY